MTDQELLELAAKAAGIEINKSPSRLLLARFGVTGWVEWNPLTDDGDALRLAVKLEMDLELTKDQLDDRSVWVYLGRYVLTEGCRNDPYAATRRAIVRAAAEIGKTMEVTK